ncbi:MAG: GNAT family N-acetyltransferase [Anaerolineae bacterium]|nr:GNAT family N-acetyltransferase [Anaerolineae bacterium]
MTAVHVPTMAFHRNWIGLLESIVNHLPSAYTWRKDGALMVRTGWRLAVFNGVVLERAESLTFDNLQHYIAPFAALGVPYSVQICAPSAEPIQDEIFLAARFTQLLCDPLMLCETDLDLPFISPEVCVRFVQDESDQALYKRMVLEGFDMSGDSAEEFLDVMLAMPESRHVVAWLGERPCGAGSLALCGGVAGVYNVTTLPFARRRGVAAAMMQMLHERARAEGYSGTALAASSMGAPLYRRLGYQADGYQLAYIPLRDYF